MRDKYYLPWVGANGKPTEQDERTMRNIEFLARDTAFHSRNTAREVQEAIYRLIGHMCGRVLR